MDSGFSFTGDYILSWDKENNGHGVIIILKKRITVIERAFGNVKDEIICIEWMDNGEKLKFIQGEGMLCVNFTGYQYGTSYVVRVAKAKIKK